jgi:hypothetical protein
MTLRADVLLYFPHAYILLTAGAGYKGVFNTATYWIEMLIDLFQHVGVGGCILSPLGGRLLYVGEYFVLTHFARHYYSISRDNNSPPLAVRGEPCFFTLLQGRFRLLPYNRV